MTIRMRFTPIRASKLLAQLDGKTGAAREARATMAAWSGGVREKTARYPGQPASSTYRRTGNLGRSFADETKVKPNSIVATVTNDAPYAKYVVGPGQRGYHSANGWANIQEVAESEWDRTTSELKKIFGG